MQAWAEMPPPAKRSHTLWRLGAAGTLARQAVALAWDYPPSLAGGWRQSSRVDDIRTFCLFVGYPRSGHSLIGALLDAHPNALLAHEQQALRYVRAGFSRRQLFALLTDNSRRFAANQAASPRHSYRVPNQWQGCVDGRLSVLGDKCAWGATLALARQPTLLNRLRTLVRADVKIIHVVRNPFDTIARMVEREEVDLNCAIDHYFGLVQTVAALEKNIPAADFLTLHHEEFVRAPDFRLAEACAFLGLQASPGYLADCASIVFPAPHQSRHDTIWNEEQQRQVQQRSKPFHFLTGYTFDD